MQDDKKLIVNKKALKYVTEIYRFSGSLPAEERYNLVSQIKRAAVSIPLNISEGAASGTKKEFAQCLSYAYRSAKEVITCLELINALKLTVNSVNIIKSLQEQGEELCKMIFSLKKSLLTTDN